MFFSPTGTQIPDSMSFKQAAGTCLASFTAFVGLFHETGANIPLPSYLPSDDYDPKNPPDMEKFGSCITVLGGSSSVGQFAIQFARIAGFTKVISTSSPQHHVYLKSLGATHLFDRNASPEELALAATPVDMKPDVEYCPIVFDAVGTTATAICGAAILSGLSPSNSGLLVSPSVVYDPALPTDVEFRGIYALAMALPETSVPYFKALEKWLETGEVQPNRVRVLGNLDNVEQALKMSEKGVSGVKLVMTL
ncbi:hypothetical protein FRB99_005443 [Tulasnella sp. 403]|nr:hypothetical protein FRB99_005443 [Tulasnella sp. 403]